MSDIDKLNILYVKAQAIDQLVEHLQATMRNYMLHTLDMRSVWYQFI